MRRRRGRQRRGQWRHSGGAGLLHGGVDPAEGGQGLRDALLGSAGITPLFEHPSGGRVYGQDGHAKALALGGSNEGAPRFYFSVFRDLDGNKLCAFSVG